MSGRCQSRPKHWQQTASLFDHLVGGDQQSGRHSEAERLGSLKVDDEAEPRRLLKGQIGGFLALQYPQDEICAVLHGFLLVWAIGH